ncbi:MAG TPA: hypothetical protein VGG88_02105, partial [Gaiellaceae bacterium]
VLALAGRHDEAMPLIERSLELAEALDLSETFAQGLITKGLVLNWKGRTREARLLTGHGLEVALANDLSSVALRAFNNLIIEAAVRGDTRAAAELNERMLELATRVGDRQQEQRARRSLASGYFYLGDWDRAEAEAAFSTYAQASAFEPIRLARGEVALARQEFEKEVAERPEGWEDQVQVRAAATGRDAEILLAEGRPAEALVRAEESLGESTTMGLHYFAPTLDIASDAALRLGNEAKLIELLARVEAIPTGHRTPELNHAAASVRARLAVVRGEDAAEDFVDAEKIMRELGWPFFLARTLVEYAEWLTATGRATDAEPILVEAAEILTPLRATAWLDRIERTRAGAGAAVA